ncbi:MAG TPA: ABC transporter substrate-binding protein [Candidatus Dormibacteraeota bacterium]|jgi:osmoprotectant transport system substrate-binding protein|nr:ABC transporter substrate-binding protein [Candidatus Dormibacteraeota bacterium]
MNLKLNSWRLVVALTALMVVAACGGTASPGTTSKGTVNVAGFNFPESSILAEIYGQALAKNNYTVNYHLLLGTRPVVVTAVKAGQIDLYPGYAASELEYFNKLAGEATSDPAATTAKLNTYLQPLGLIALTPSAAQDANAFAVPQAIATKYNLTKLSDITPAIASQLTFGAGPECPTYKFCLPGLAAVYGLHFKAVKTLDTDGPLTRAAFKNGTIQIGLVFTTDADLKGLGLVVLQDDKNMTAADNVLPVLRQPVATDDVKTILNNVDSKLTTADLVSMVDQVANQHQDASAVAATWLQQHP